LGIWRSALDARHATLTAQWCAANGLVLPDCVDDGVLRFHSRLSFGDVRVPGLLWLLTDIKSAEPVGILRYFLADDGTVIGKRILGRGFGTAIRLSPDDAVEQGLFIAQTIEVGLRALSGGLAPVWVATGEFPATLAGIELTVLK
jgi:hypothetical protein